ncbi:cupin domain-containing protein [Novosphingobium sp. PS1R-30]|uniref:Cupin domain-containing protein n=1 Tax=Novosphingobium anseongense TaxID=3133436 RepID=A0ABU8RTS5_9SPHN
MRLTQFDTAAFLRDTWQQRPLLIRNPWALWQNPLEPDELAGLACEDTVESRLVATGKAGWKAEGGPFEPAHFGKLGKKPWTLLVQAVDHHVPDVAALIEAFRFVPNWRIDDVMVSYASDRGGVGPHFDQYDVFLIQGLGRRRWQIGGTCDHTTPLLPHDDLRLLADFEPVEEWVLEPGDILYVPPGVAHNGVALGDDCMTYSIGFRAPSRGELIAHWCDHVLGGLQDGDRYGDHGLAAQDNPGEITADAIARLQAMIAEKMLDRDSFARWFGEYTTAPKYPDMDWRPEQPFDRADLCAGVALSRNPASRFSYVAQGAGVLLFVDGRTWECGADVAGLARQLCALARVVLVEDPSEAAIALLADLIEAGCLAIDED